MSLKTSQVSAKAKPEEDDSVKLGDSIINGTLQPPSSAKETDPSVALGDSIISGTLQPSQTTQPAQANPPSAPPQTASQGSPLLNAISPDISANPVTQALRGALAGNPNDYQMHGLGRILPIAHDEVTGQNRLAMPQAIQQMGNGILDLIQGPRTGVVTPDAQAVLLSGALAGKLNPSPVSPQVSAIPLSSAQITANSERAANAVTSPEFRANPMAPGFDPKTPPGPTSANPNFEMPKNAPKPNTDPDSSETKQFAQMIKQMMDAQKGSWMGRVIQGAVAGGQIGGPHGAVAGAVLNPILQSVIGKLSPAIQKAVMANLKEYAAPQAIVGGAANPLLGNQ